MKISHAAGLAGLVLAAGALPVTAYALSAAHTPAPVVSGPASADTPEAEASQTEPPETEAPGTEAPETEAPGTEAPGPADDSGMDPAQPEGSGHPNPASAPGRAHAAAMQAWAHCVAAAASGPKTPGQQVPPKLACGDKPLAPGRAKHQPPATPGAPVAPQLAPWSHGNGHAKGHGHGKGR